MPERIQRKREKGWRKPEGAVIVTRPTRWGNVYRPHNAPIGTDPQAWMVEAYREWLNHNEQLVAEARLLLRGFDLACYCPLDQPCHADVLLEISNAPRSAR